MWLAVMLNPMILQVCTLGGLALSLGRWDLPEQGSQVSMCVARGSASWLSSHGRGLGPRDALKKDSRGLSRGAAGQVPFRT